MTSCYPVGYWKGAGSDRRGVADCYEDWYSVGRVVPLGYRY